jgi:hypothetical protein
LPRNDGRPGWRGYKSLEDQPFSMDKGFKHRVSELVMAIGFLTALVGGLGVGFLTLETEHSAMLGIGGFVVFLVGVEVYLRTRETPY